MTGRVEEHDPTVTGLVVGAGGALGERVGGRRLEVIDREVEMKLLAARLARTRRVLRVSG